MPLIFRQGPAGAAFTAAVAAWLVFEFVMRARQRRQAGGPAAADPTYLVLVACLVAAVISAEVLGRDGQLPWPGGLVWPAVAGVGLIVAGIALRAWSITALGRLFQYQITIQPGHRVVTSGPYRYLRHPSYSAVALVLAGIALACDDVWSLVAAAALGGMGLAMRIRAEERQLTQALGAEYEHFSATRKRLVPGVW
jgi:protein-S-isoprenylcysteine O-methyltransferase Ste14